MGGLGARHPAFRRHLSLAALHPEAHLRVAVKYPGEEKTSARPLRVSPAYDRHRALDAAFGEKSGWERVNWYESNAASGDASLRPHGWAGENWSPAISAEAAATRTTAGLFDESSFAKIEVLGPGALALLQRLCANDVDRPVGKVTYTQMLNARGGIECDLSVIRLETDRFLLITGTAFGTHDRGWIARHAPGDGSVYVTDVTSSRACFGLWGPNARAILQPLTKTSLANADFPYMTAQEIAVGDVPCLAVRVTYVGELGWELYPPSEFGAALWDTLWEAGRDHGLVACGYKAIDALRLEKGYRAWASDITPDTTPDEAGLSFAVKVDKGADFIGRDAIIAARAAGTPGTVLACLVLDDPRAIALGSEPVRLPDGDAVGRVTTGGYGFAVGSSIAWAWVGAAHSTPGTRLEIDIFGRQVGAEVRAEPLYDPKGERIRG